MKEKQFLDWVVYTALGILFGLNVIYFVHAVGNSRLILLGWVAVMIGIGVFAGLINRQPAITSRKVFDLFLVICAIGAFTLLQTSVIVYLLFRDKTPIVWLLSLMLVVTMIGLTLYKYR